MNKDAEVVAILNKNQVLVHVLDAARFDRRGDFLVFRVAKLPPEAAQKVGRDHVELPKGTLRFESYQSDKQFAVLGSWQQVVRRVEKRSAMDEILGQGLLAKKDVVVTEPGEVSAELNDRQSLNLNAGPVSVGDFCSAD
jgi:hypothetical protein